MIRGIIILSFALLTFSILLIWVTTAIRSAFNAVERTRVEETSKNGHPRADTLLHLIDNPLRSLAPINLLAAAALLGAGIAATAYTLRDGAPPASITTELILIIVVLLIGKIIADVIGTARAFGIALAVATPLTLVLNLFAPLLNLSAWITRHAKGSRARARNPEKVTSDDIQIILAEGEEPRKLDEIEPEEREMIASIIEMGERAASEIMIPRLDVIALEVTSSIEEALDVAAKYGHSRIPVYEESIDHVLGILHVKELIQAVRHPDRQVTLRELLRPVHYVPETAKADDLLRDLLRTRVHMAVVVDEYGGTAGVVTIEDALEEIVGEIRDEYDTAEEPEFVRVDEDEAIFKGRVPVSEVNDALALDLPTEETDTLGGLLYTRIGRMVRPGDNVLIGSVELTVTATLGRRIKKIRVRKLQLPEIPSKVAEPNGKLKDGINAESRRTVESSS